MSEESVKYFQQWIEKAEEDRLVVQQLIDADSTARGAIGFHCQQAAEKFLKAYLIVNGIDPEKNHNLEFLVRRCSDISPGPYDQTEMASLMIRLRN